MADPLHLALRDGVDKSDFVINGYVIGTLFGANKGEVLQILSINYENNDFEGRVIKLADYKRFALGHLYKVKIGDIHPAAIMNGAWAKYNPETKEIKQTTAGHFSDVNIEMGYIGGVDGIKKRKTFIEKLFSLIHD